MEGYCSRVETEAGAQQSRRNRDHEERAAKSHWRDRRDRSWVTLEAGEAKMYQHLLVREAMVLTDGLPMEAEEEERKEEDMNEQGLPGSSDGHVFSRGAAHRSFQHPNSG